MYILLKIKRDFFVMKIIYIRYCSKNNTIIQNETGVIFMELISILGKKYVKDILLALDKHGSLHSGALSKIIGCPPGTLSRRLNMLEEAGLVKTYYENFENLPLKNLPLRLCELTELGKRALILYDISEKINNLNENQTIVCHIINGDKNIINSNISNSNIDIK